ERKRRSVGEFQQGTEILDHHGLSHAPERYGVAGGPGGPPERADQLPDGALQDPRQGPPLPSGDHDAGGPAPAPARLPEEQGREALSRPDRQARNPQVGPRDRPRPTLPPPPRPGPAARAVRRTAQALVLIGPHNERSRAPGSSPSASTFRLIPPSFA